MRLSNLVVISCCIILSACGGDGSNGGVKSTPTPIASFTSFGSVQPNVSTKVEGTTREGTLSVSSTGVISNITTPIEGNGSVTFTLDSQRQATALSVAGSSSSVAFNSSSPAFVLYDQSNRAVGVAVENASGSDQALYADPYLLGFSYQSFGVWASNLVPGATARFGAISVGAKTAGSAVPSSGNVAFNGRAGGVYVDPNGVGFRYGAYATFAVNFAGRSVAMTTSGDRIWRISDDAMFTVTAPIIGNMTYSPGGAFFSGTVNTQNNVMTGTGSGWFYGPSANELGGTFFISGTGGKLVGGFGAGR